LGIKQPPSSCQALYNGKDGSKRKLVLNYRLPKKIKFVSRLREVNQKQTSYDYFKKATVSSKVEWQRDVDCCSKRVK